MESRLKIFSKDIPVNGKRIIVRLDLNVPISNSKIDDDTRIKVVVKPFLNKIIDDYKWADLVISRSGAGVINEILAVGVASVLVPLPNSIDDHQRANANMIRDNNAAVVIEQGDNFKNKILKFITGVQLKDLSEMANRARKMSTTDASEKISKNILRLVDEK